MYLFSRFFGIGMDCLSSMILLSPAVLVILKLSGRKIVSTHTVLLLLYVCVLAGIYSVTGLPDIRYSNFEPTLNLIPMADLLSSPEQYLMNILMFLPVGFLLPLLWDQYKDLKLSTPFFHFFEILFCRHISLLCDSRTYTIMQIIICQYFFWNFFQIWLRFVTIHSQS